MGEQRRQEEHEKMGELSRYYLLKGDSKVWKGPELLKEGKLGHGR